MKIAILLLMENSIGHIAVVVRDYDEAIAYYTRALGFLLLSDEPQEGKRWVLVGPRSGGTSLLLAQASTKEQEVAIGNQTGGRVFLFLYVSDFDAEYARMRQEGVTFLEPPRDEPYGKVAVFKDLYGNKWDLLERK